MARADAGGIVGGALSSGGERWRRDGPSGATRDGFGLAAIPGSILLASGVACLLWPGDPRARHFGAAGGFAGLLLALPAVAWAGAAAALGLAVLSAASCAAIGFLTIRGQDVCEDVPPPRHTLREALEVAVDEAVLAQMTIRAPAHALRGDGQRVVDEVHRALELFRDRGWVEKPLDYHQTPAVLDEVELRPRRTRGVAFEHLRFESGFSPHPEEPGRDRYLRYESCRTGHAWVLRDPDPGRPWLVCIHGYQMGSPLVDFGAFRPEWLHDRLGLNLLLPVLPMHGPRKIRRVSGDGFLAGDLLDTVHALAQTAWDLRRLLSWIRTQGGEQVGVLGLSLGGYSTALLASLTEELSCAIAGIPATDFARLSWRHGAPEDLRRAEEAGVGLGETSDLKRVISPLVLAPRVPRSRRYIFGGTVDQLVPPDHVCDLWRHWEHPAVYWYPGAHCTFPLHRPVRRFIEHALQESGLTA
jgi:hypothetical protein